jgi:glycosyltransferase involved in cell wall biosynthesis
LGGGFVRLFPLSLVRAAIASVNRAIDLRAPPRFLKRAMRILRVSQMTPYLSCHDGFRVLTAHLLENLARRHTVALISATSPDETSEQRRWAASPCMALGTPIVASSRSLSGLIDVVPGEHVLMADDNETTAENVLRLLTDEAFAASMASRARTLVEGVYAWAAVGRHYDALLARVAGTALEATA